MSKPQQRTTSLERGRGHTNFTHQKGSTRSGHLTYRESRNNGRPEPAPAYAVFCVDHVHQRVVTAQRAMPKVTACGRLSSRVINRVRKSGLHYLAPENSTRARPDCR